MMTIDERAKGTVPIILLALTHYQGNEVRPGYSKEDFLSDLLKPMLIEAVKAEREACAAIAENIRARELAKYDGRNAPYDTIAEEIRDRILMRPATSNDDWPELPGLNKRGEK